MATKKLDVMAAIEKAESEAREKLETQLREKREKALENILQPLRTEQAKLDEEIKAIESRQSEIEKEIAKLTGESVKRKKRNTRASGASATFSDSDIAAAKKMLSGGEWLSGKAITEKTGVVKVAKMLKGIEGVEARGPGRAREFRIKA